MMLVNLLRKTNAVLKNLNTFDVHSMPILVDRFRVFDIDTPEDWKFAELMGKYLIKNDSFFS